MDGTGGNHCKTRYFAAKVQKHMYFDGAFSPPVFRPAKQLQTQVHGRRIKDINGGLQTTGDFFVGIKMFDFLDGLLDDDFPAFE